MVPLLLEENGHLKKKSYSRKELNEVYMDVGLAGGPIQCEPTDGACEEMREEMEFRPRYVTSPADPYWGSSHYWGQNHQYTIDVGECTVESHIACRLLTRSHGIFWSRRRERLVGPVPRPPRWRECRFQGDDLPGVELRMVDAILPLCGERLAGDLGLRYLPQRLLVLQPVQHDYSDLYNTMAFFVGTPDGTVKGQDEIAARISRNAVDFVAKHWRFEDMEAYVSVTLA